MSEDGRKGVDWVQVDPEALSSESKALYRKYFEAFYGASDIASELKTRVQAEWDKQNPKGINGQFASFNAIGGTLLFAMKEQKNGKEKKSFSTIVGGANPFSKK